MLNLIIKLQNYENNIVNIIMDRSRFRPKNKDELKKAIESYDCEATWNEHGTIGTWDVSNITDMSSLFVNFITFGHNYDISRWDVSNVTDMNSMFLRSDFNGDISNWDVSNVTIMQYMFYESNFNNDISEWDVSNVTNVFNMFRYSQFNSDISKWNLSSIHCLRDVSYVFGGCPIRKQYKPVLTVNIFDFLNGEMVQYWT
jgi:surface protein